MKQHWLDRDHLGHNEDFYGNNAAFTCPVCGKVFVVSGLRWRRGQECPECGRSTGFVDLNGATARIEWEPANE